jgi:hypothetical protein
VAIEPEEGVEPSPGGRAGLATVDKIAFTMVGCQTLLQSEDLPVVVEPEEGVEPSLGGRADPATVAFSIVGWQTLLQKTSQSWE